VPRLEKTEVVTVRLTEPLRLAAEEAAERAGMTFADWLRGVVFRAAHEGAFAPPKKGVRRARTSKKEG